MLASEEGQDGTLAVQARQEEEAGACAEFYIDGERLELFTRHEIFAEFDTKRMFPKDGSLAKLKLPPDLFEEEGEGNGAGHGRLRGQRRQ